MEPSASLAPDVDKTDTQILAEGTLLLTRSSLLLAAHRRQPAAAAAQPVGACVSGILFSWLTLSLPMRLSFLASTLLLLAATYLRSPGAALHCLTCHGAPLERVHLASRAWALGSWGAATPQEPPLLPQEDFVFLGTASSYHNFTRGCGSALQRQDVLQLRWRPRPASGAVPSYPPWSRRALCTAIGGSNIAVVGDSLSGEFYDTLVAALAHRPDYGNVPRLNRCWRRRICSAPGEVPAYAHFINTATLVVDDLYGNEFTNPDGAGEEREGAATPGGQPCLAPPNQDTLSGRMSWREQLRIALEDEGDSSSSSSSRRRRQPPIVIGNTGAHYYGDNEGAVESVWDFFAYARLLAPTAALFYRTTPSGHPGCGPLRLAPPLPAPLPLQAFLEDAATVEYMWWRFANFTSRVVAGLGSGVVVVDVDLATALRADSHPYREDKFGVAGGAAGDCLHYCIPGPIDTWVEMWAALLRLQRLGEGEEEL
jgi:hypothetical protein